MRVKGLQWLKPFNIILAILLTAMLLTSTAPVMAEAGDEQGQETGQTGEELTEGDQAGDEQGEEAPESENPDAEVSLEAYEKIAEQDRLALYAILKTGEIAVEDKLTGEIWYSNPPDREKDTLANGFYKVSLNSQLLMSFSDPKGVVLQRGSFLHSVQRNGLSYEKRGDTIVFKYRFVQDGIMIPVQYSISGDCFTATVLTDEVEEGENVRLLTVDLLPFFGAAGVDDEGYILVPDGSGALIYLNNGKTAANTYQAPVYGEDQGQGGLLIPASSAHLATITNKEAIRIPVFGMKKNNTGFLAVIASSEARANIIADIAGRGTYYNKVHSQLEFRRAGSVMLTQKEFAERKSSIPERLSARGTPFEVKYFFLDEADADYVGMAKRYREYQKSATGLDSVVKAGDIPLYIDLYGYVNKVKPFLGIPIERVIPLTTLDDIRTITNELFDNGIHNVVVKYNNWVKGASFKKMPVNAVIEGKLGSVKDFKALEQELREKGGSIYLSADLLNVYRTGNGFSRYSDALKNVANTPLVLRKYVLDSAAVDSSIPGWFLLNPKRFDKFYSRFISNLAKYGTQNVGLDSLGSMAYSDLSSNGTSRTDIPGIVASLLDKIQDTMPSILLEQANAYAIPYAEHVINTPGHATYYDILDEHIPFYQIVYHGMVNYSMVATNLSSSPEYVFLKCLETGAAPMYSWVGRNSEELFNSRLNHLFSADYKAWIGDAIRDYRKINDVLSKVSTSEITAHEKLTEGVYRTTYGDMLDVYVNYNEDKVTIEGITIDGYGYTVREAGGLQ